MKSTSQTKYIALFGVTGSGRTKFINTVTDSTLREGNTHSQCTLKVQTAECELDGQRIVFIDTPGFDEDGAVPFLNIKRELRRMKREGKQVVGAIYTHRVVDYRPSDPALRNFEVFCNKVGNDAMPNVSVVTTMWSHVEKAEDAEKRHRELCAHGFRTAVDGGATVSGYDDTKASAEDIVRALLNRSSGDFSLN